MRFLVVAALLLAGCASQGIGDGFKSGIPYPTYEAAARSSIFYSIDRMDFGRSLEQSDRSAVIECLTKSFVSGIPEADQSVILNAMNKQNYDAAANEVVKKWFDSTGGHQRIADNVDTYCPAFAAKYPNLKAIS